MLTVAHMGVGGVKYAQNHAHVINGRPQMPNMSYRKQLARNTSLVSKYSMISIISTGSVKRTGLAIFSLFLLNVSNHVYLNVLVSIKRTGFR